MNNCTALKYQMPMQNVTSNGRPRHLTQYTISFTTFYYRDLLFLNFAV